MTDPAQLPPAAVVIRLQVADFDKWKEVFDSAEPTRREHGIVGHHINRSKDDPNNLSVYLAASDVEKAKAWATSDELKSAMAEAGVSGAPDFVWMKPLREEIVWDRDLPAMMISHRVDDVDAWLAAYDDARDLQRSHGIVGHAANQSIDDESQIIVYHQAESFDKLQAFMSLDELKSTMKEAGVVSEPEVSFHTGGSGKTY